MEVNKEAAEQCRDLGAKASRDGNLERAVKLLEKSLRLYPLPGVEAMLTQTKATILAMNNINNNRTPPPPRRTESVGEDGRTYTQEQVDMVAKVLKAKEGGQGAHYRVLGVPKTASDGDLKKAYRKLALKLHPDKNSAPHADEAFKAVGLAYGTLSDRQKRTIYDTYGEEDPDNRGAAGRGPGGGGMQYRQGQEVSPEDIFNMFFGAGMAQGGRGPGFHVYTNGFGGGFPGGFAGQQFAGQRARQQHAGQHHQQQNGAPWMQLLPFIVIMIMSFLNFGGQDAGVSMQNKYFSLVQQAPFVNPLATKLSGVKDIPYFVTDKFMRTYHRDRYQLAQVERMVEKNYHDYVMQECKAQKKYKRQLEQQASRLTGEERASHLRRAEEFELSRCIEFENLFRTRDSGSQQKRATYRAR